jgi:hypothetical protein
MATGASSPWENLAFLAEARGWIEAHVAVTGEIEQPHVRPWSTVLRVPTGDGVCWFKANIPACAHEAGVVSVLARERPGCVPKLLAVDLERGWLLMNDGGERLREVIEQEHSLQRWHDVLPEYARLQIALAERAHELVDQGVPDRRLETLASQYEQLLNQIDGVPEHDVDRLRKQVPRVHQMCEQLSSYRMPETIQHDDLHDAQIFVRDGSYLFYDWGDSCVSHPFFSMAVTLEGQLAWGLDDIEGSEDIRPYRDAYLQPFTHYANQKRLEEAHTIAIRLGWICRALNWHRFASALDPPDRQEKLQGVGLRLQLFLSGSPAGDQ